MMRRTKPAAVSARGTSWTAWWDTSPRLSRTTLMIEFVSTCDARAPRPAPLPEGPHQVSALLRVPRTLETQPEVAVS
jgi:hypothetical protein